MTCLSSERLNISQPFSCSMRSEQEVREELEEKQPRLQYGAWKQDYIEIEMLEWVLGIRDEQPDSRFSEPERVGNS